MCLYLAISLFSSSWHTDCEAGGDFKSSLGYLDGVIPPWFAKLLLDAPESLMFAAHIMPIIR